MKNFTQTMKSALMGLLAVFAMATSSNAKVTGVSDLFGKYKFTATIQYTEAGKAYEGQFKENSDVTIEKHDIMDGQIIGLAGSLNGLQVNTWNDEKQSMEIYNPNQGGVWGDLYMADAEGNYPFNGMKPEHAGKSYSPSFTYNEADGSVSIPDFTLGKGDFQAETFTVFVKFTNVKLTLVSLDKVDVADLSGDWHFKAGKGTYDTMEGSTLPTEFDMSITAKDASFKAYSVMFKYADFEPVEMDAEFNGSVLKLNLDSTSLDTAEHIYIIAENYKFPQNYHASIDFNYTDNGTLSLTSAFDIVRNAAVSADKPKGRLQWFMAGIAKRPGGEVANGWAGTYNFTADNVIPIISDVFTPEKNFTMTVVETEQGFFVTEMFGMETIQGGFKLEPNKDDPSKATILAGVRYLKMIEGGKTYLTLGDRNATDDVINLTKNDDNTISMDNVSVLLYDFQSKTTKPAAAYVGVKGTLGAAPVVPDFSWEQTFKVTADVQSFIKDYEYPAEFDMTVVRDNSGLMVTHFLGNDISAVNYGGAGFTVDKENSKKAAIAGGANLKMVEPGKLYLILGDMNTQLSPVTMEADADGNLTIANFTVLLKTWGSTEKPALAAYYTNVKATPVATGIENVEKSAANVWVKNGAVCLGQAQNVKVYDFSGKCVYSGVTAEVSGLAKGLYIVKTATGVAKVLVR